MSSTTTNFGLVKPAKTDSAAISVLNTDLDKIDEEMAKPPLTVNETEPDENRNIEITTVPLADNLTSDEMQINTGTYIIRTSGGEASIKNGSAMLSELRGNMVKTGHTEQVVNMAVTGANIQNTTIDDNAFIAEMTSASGTMTFSYTDAWSSNPSLYGINVSGTPQNGDSIVVTYAKENRGTITVATPTSFVSTGWNLYNHVSGYARVFNYSEEYGFMIGGTYTSIAFAETLSGEQTPITPINGFFSVPSAGYVFVTGGNATDTMIWLTWSNWMEEPNGGVFEPYSQTSVDLSGVMVNFPNGLMRVGNYYDEINLNTGKAYSRIEKIEYNAENLEEVILSGVPYDVDQWYIYAVLENPVTYNIDLDGEYTANDHGMEMFIGTSVPVTASSLYGNDLKAKLRTDVVTISQQDLTAQQQTQIRQNIGAVGLAEMAEKLSYWSTNVNAQSTKNVSLKANGRYLIVFDAPATTSKCLAIVAVNNSGVVSATKIGEASNITFDTGTAKILKVGNGTTQTVGIFVVMLQ